MAEDEARPRLRLRTMDRDPSKDDQALTDPDDAAFEGPIPHHDARALTRGGNLVRIDLDGTAYVLRITRNGKLILTK